MSRMKAGSILINTSRGGVVDELALKKFLQNGHLGGAGLDVFQNEPILADGLCRLPTLVGTPHIGGNAAEAVAAMGEAAINHLLRHFSGAPAAARPLR